MPVIASEINSVIPLISYIIGEMFVGVCDAFPLGDTPGVTIVTRLLMSDF